MNRRRPATEQGAPPAPDGGSLARCVDDVAKFADAVWGRDPHHWPASPAPSGHDAPGDDFSDVFSVAIADELLAHVARRPTIRVVENGSNVDTARYTSTLRLGGRWIDVVDQRKVADLFAHGASVVYQSLHRTCPPVRRFVDGLARDISHPIQANAYLTPPGSTALAPHADTHDVIVIQLAGHKHWNVDGLGDITIRPGDRMYVPAGTTHSATSGDRSSLHLTVGIIRTTYRSVVDRLLADVRQLDEPLPLDYRDPAAVPDFAEHVRAALDSTSAALGHVDVDDVVERERRRRRPAPAARTIGDVVALDDLGPDSELAWNDRFRIEEPTDNDTDTRLVVTDGRRTVRIPIAARPALEHLRGAETGASVGGLPDLDAPSRIVVARRLLDDGVCRLVDHG